MQTRNYFIILTMKNGNYYDDDYVYESEEVIFGESIEDLYENISEWDNVRTRKADTHIEYSYSSVYSCEVKEIYDEELHHNSKPYIEIKEDEDKKMARLKELMKVHIKSEEEKERALLKKLKEKYEK